MEKVCFPGLGGLEFNISQVAFNFFGIDIYTYAFCIVFGIILALFLARMSKENFGIKYDCIIEISIYTLIFGIIGARIFYILFNLDYYFRNPIKIVAIRNGGLAIYGGLLAGLITIYKRSKKMKINFVDLLDYIIPFVAIAQSCGRWGNFFNIEAYGSTTSIFCRMGISTKNGYMEVHPTFLYESIVCLIIFVILRLMQKNRKFSGQIVLWYLMLYCGARFFIEGLRTDSLMFFNYKISQIISLILFSISAFFTIKQHFLIHKKE